MKCQICGKNNATIHIREIANGEKKSYYICEECAAKKKSSGIPDIAEIICRITGAFSRLQDGNNLKMPGKKAVPEKEEIPDLRCPACGWGMEQWKKTGRLGCPECYHTFENSLKEVFGKMHKGLVHTGKHPVSLMPDAALEAEEGKKKRTVEKEIARMQSELDSAVAHEDYEKAAVLRDKIFALRGEFTPPEEKKNPGKKGLQCSRAKLQKLPKRSSGRKGKKAADNADIDDADKKE